MINVLMTVPSLNKSSGVARFAYNLFNHIDAEQIHMDFLHQRLADPTIETYDDDVIVKGSKVFEVANPSSDLFQFIRDVSGVMKEHGQNYQIIHCNVPNAAWCYLLEAKRAGIANRILHSHSNKSSDILSHRIRNAPLLRIGDLFATERYACSEDAGKYLFKGEPFQIIKNGIALSDYEYRRDWSRRHRVNLGIPEDAIVVGFVGRLVPAKNIPFLIEVFEEILKIHMNAFLVIVGNGPERDSVQDRIASCHVDGKVKLLGARTDANELYSLFDVFVMPSITEGLPFAAVEAQAAGLRCLFSDSIPHDTDITRHNVFLDLGEDKRRWAEQIIDLAKMDRNSNSLAELSEKGFDSDENALELLRLYKQIAQ